MGIFEAEKIFLPEKSKCTGTYCLPTGTVIPQAIEVLFKHVGNFFEESLESNISCYT
jgi:hypothetical protein